MGRLVGILIPIAIQIGVAAVTMSALPDRVASQFGLNGEPSNFMSPQMYFLVIALEAVVLNVTFLGLAAVFEQNPSLKWANLPWKSHWISTPERALEGARRLVRFLRVGAWGANVIVLAAQLLILGQNGVIPFALHPNVFVGATFAATIVYFVWCFTLFKPAAA